MRRVKVWLVTEVTDWVDTVIETPIIAFQDLEDAKRCAAIRDERAKRYRDPVWTELDQIEVVLDD